MPGLMQTWGWNPGPLHDRQALYHMSQTSSAQTTLLLKSFDMKYYVICYKDAKNYFWGWLKVCRGVCGVSAYPRGTWFPLSLS